MLDPAAEGALPAAGAVEDVAAKSKAKGQGHELMIMLRNPRFQLVRRRDGHAPVDAAAPCVPQRASRGRHPTPTRMPRLRTEPAAAPAADHTAPPAAAHQPGPDGLRTWGSEGDAAGFTPSDRTGAHSTLARFSRVVWGRPSGIYGFRSRGLTQL